MSYFKMNLLHLFAGLFAAFTLVCADPRSHYFYDKHGIMTIDGSVPGQSEPITLDMKSGRFFCSQRQHFVFTFCPDFEKFRKAQMACEEGIIFCYDPQLTPERARRSFALNTVKDLDVTKKCGEMFRGFKVALKKMHTAHSPRVLIYVYEIQLGYAKEPLYFPASQSCINLWLGNADNLLASVRNADNKEIKPIQMEDPKDGKKILGRISNGSFDRMPTVENYELYGEAAQLNMLYLDFKSREFEQQMMYTVGPKGRCSLFARVNSNMVGKCQSQFRQKSTALRSYGHGSTTSYTLTIESGVDTSDKRGQRKIVSALKSLITEESEETENTEFIPQGMQASQDEQVLVDKKKQLKHTSTEEKEEKDETPLLKKIAGKVATFAIGALCNGVSAVWDFFTGGSAGNLGCNGGMEWKDTTTTTFREAYTENSLHKVTSSSSSVSKQSLQNTMKQGFTHTQGHSESTTKITESSVTMSVSERTVFQWTVEVPAGKVITPMQMLFDCDNNKVAIPWLKFKLTNEGDHGGDVLEDYADENDPNAVGKGKVEIPSEQELLDKLSDQQIAAEQAFAPKPADYGNDGTVDYASYVEGPASADNGDKKPNKEKASPYNDDGTVDYASYLGES